VGEFSLERARELLFLKGYKDSPARPSDRNSVKRRMNELE
jgi:hypothetical protein